MSTPNYPVSCPTCGVEPGARCRSLTTRRTTDTHIARIMASSELAACAAVRMSGMHFGCDHE